MLERLTREEGRRREWLDRLLLGVFVRLDNLLDI